MPSSVFRTSMRVSALLGLMQGSEEPPDKLDFYFGKIFHCSCLLGKAPKFCCELEGAVWVQILTERCSASYRIRNLPFYVGYPHAIFQSCLKCRYCSLLTLPSCIPQEINLLQDLTPLWHTPVLILTKQNRTNKKNPPLACL